MLAPIVLFVYNRPWHTEQTLNALMKNKLANESILYVYADGHKENGTSEDLKKIAEVRELVKSNQWCKEVIVRSAPKNKGLADSIIEGVTNVVNRYGKVIVLEDDIVTSASFLLYMNQALERFENENKIFSVSAFMIPNTEKLPSTFLYRAPSSWGWATWKRAWKHYEHNTGILLTKISENDRSNFDIGNCYPYYQHLLLNHQRKLHTWAVKWYASIYIQNGLCLWPAKSLIRNIGHDGTGQNCQPEQLYYLNQKIHTKYNLKKLQLTESIIAVEIFKRFYTNRHSFLQLQQFSPKIYFMINRIKNKIKRTI